MNPSETAASKAMYIRSDAIDEASGQAITVRKPVTIT